MGDAFDRGIRSQVARVAPGAAAGAALAPSLLGMVSGAVQGLARGRGGVARRLAGMVGGGVAGAHRGAGQALTSARALLGSHRALASHLHRSIPREALSRVGLRELPGFARTHPALARSPLGGVSAGFARELMAMPGVRRFAGSGSALGGLAMADVPGLLRSAGRAGAGAWDATMHRVAPGRFARSLGRPERADTRRLLRSRAARSLLPSLAGGTLAGAMGGLAGRRKD